MKTYVAKEKDINRKWYFVDAKGKVLGRLATRVASILRGKHKAIYTPYIDTGDYVIIVNADKITVTGDKLKSKVYKSFSGYPGGLKVTNLETMMEKDSTRVVRLAIQRMLPGNPLGRDMIKKVKIYSGSEHPHKAQCSEPLKI
mgnify:CR=1 FL=1